MLRGILRTDVMATLDDAAFGAATQVTPKSGSSEPDRSRGGRAPDNAAKARHRPTRDQAQPKSRAPGDRPAPLLQGRTNKTAALDPAPTDPSWPVPAADRVNVRESLFAEAFNRLLQQNRHETDVPNQSSHVRYQGMNRPTLARTLTSEIDPKRASRSIII